MEQTMDEKMEAYNYMRKLDFFDKLSKDTIWPLANVAVKRHFGANELLIKDNSEPVGIFVLQKGKVQVFKTTEDGSEITLAELNPGHMFGEISVMDRLNTTASVRTMEECDCFFISEWDFNT